MAGITAAGTGSGIDIESLVTSLMAAEKTSLTKLTTKKSTIQSKISLIGQFKSLVSSLQTTANNLQNLGKLTGVKATVADTSLASATVTNEAAAGTYTLDVTQLAKAQQIVTQSSAGFTSASTELVSSTGSAATVTITVGKVSGSTLTDATSQEITLEPGATLQDLVDQINDGDYGVSASLIKDTSGSVRLSLTGTDTGAENAFKIETSDTSLSALNFDPASASSTTYTVNASAQDSKFDLNGVEIVRSSNTIDDAVDGLTINLLSETSSSNSSSSSTTFTVASDSNAISTQLKAFVDAYNQLASAIKSSTSYNSTTKVAGALQGDSTIRSMQNQLRSFMTGVFGDGSNSTKTLSSLGISFQKDGTLALDSDKLKTAVTNDLDSVIEFLGAFDQSLTTVAPESSKDGFAYKLAQLTKGMLDDNGLIDAKLDGLNKSVDNIEDQYERLEFRLEQVEKRYRTQFTAMDTAVANMQNLGTYVTQLLNMTDSSSS